MNRRNATFAAFATAAAPYEPWREGDEYRAAPRYYVAVKLGEGDWETTSYKTRREADAAASSARRRGTLAEVTEE